MNDFKNIPLRKWIFIFIFSTIAAPVLISAENSTHFSILIPDVKVNFYSIPSANEQPVKDLEVHDSLKRNATKKESDESRNFNANIPEDPHYCQNDQTIPCNPLDRYRTIDGSCNNINHPTWGIVNECYMRYLPAAYEGFEDFQKSKNGDPLPPVRDLTVNIFKDVHRPSPNISFMFTIYGQTVAHDVSLSENKNILEKCCGDSPGHEYCIHISIRANDSFYSPFNVTCMELHRTLSCEFCNTTKRQQVNGVTAALDASMVYGTNNKRMMDVRANDGTGKMAVSSTEYGDDLLPEDNGRYGIFCRQKKLLTCFMTGDVRVNQHFYLTGISTYYMREHNRIATILKKMNPHWEEERLYQEARRINTATLQCITYKEYLPVLLGPYIMDQFNLTIKNGSHGTNYNSSLRLGVSNEFSTAAFRLHSMVPKFMDGQHSRFKDYYSNPELLQKGNMEEIMQGSYKVPSEEYDHYYVDDVTNYMAKRRGVPYGLDLGSLDIQRGRDHGIAPYVVMVRFCSEGRVVITTFDDLAPLLMTEENAEMLKENYNAVEDIDLFVGIQIEKLFPGAAVGPTAACVIAMQFYSNKFGDRFFFEHKGEVPSFTAAQRNSLKQCSLSRILCDNSDVRYIPKNAMLLPSITNPEVPCEEIPEIDLSLWAERPSLS
ncbi:peroxidase-like isoform X1 [Argiope bruennichi]|uniref:peroxidase-like isoform X1 n=1 Tax=Argiope bruennichi TaxID=94029 RepID=UPI002495A584|nr:peroxidase-like isoform X1 [Argiope bruennichi]